jgi:GNAT superfamily N-acetyltransferase
VGRRSRSFRARRAPSPPGAVPDLDGGARTRARHVCRCRHGFRISLYVATVLIRDAIEDDWPSIYPFFSEIVAAGRTYAYPEDLLIDDARSYWMTSPPGRTVVALDGEVVAGTATMGPNRPGRGSHIATAGFMVDPRHQSRGVGRSLGNEVIDWARREGYRAIQFNAVVETNEAAVYLWKSLGFDILATVPEAFDHAEHGFVGLHVMYRRLP